MQTFIDKEKNEGYFSYTNFYEENNDCKWKIKV